MWYKKINEATSVRVNNCKTIDGRYLGNLPYTSRPSKCDA